MPRMILLILALFSVTASAADDWTTTDTVLTAAVVTAEVLDWSQTRYIAKHPGYPPSDPYREHNAFMGSHPTVGRVDLYFVGEIAAGAGLLYVLNPTQRRVLLGAKLGLELVLVGRNRRIGIKFAF